MGMGLFLSSIDDKGKEILKDEDEMNRYINMVQWNFHLNVTDLAKS